MEIIPQRFQPALDAVTHCLESLETRADRAEFAFVLTRSIGIWVSGNVPVETGAAGLPPESETWDSLSEALRQYSLASFAAETPSN